MQAMNTKVYRGTLTCLYHLILKLFLDFLYHFLNACGMDTSVGNELVECKAAHLTAYWVESTDNDSLWSVVDNNLHSCRCLKGTDVSTFTTDYSAFHLIVIYMEHTHAVFNSRFSGNSLYCLNDNLTCLGISI